MASIKPLSEAVHSSMRSGIILFDLTRVVEELVYNSLDAGATKVSVSIGIGTCYVKVVDDGCGITRDGLVLLGERYATSKLHHLADMDDTKGSYGFRGEALGSISDVSLLEIVTKAQGRPIGYRKVMKGCKCLYLGIDDDRQDVGTTVVVRDLFYNQPVRRKHMQSSPGKVLHSVKKCVLLIALVHSKVSFKVVDVESENEVFYTHPSSSPLSLVMSGFGIAISGSLHELNLSDGILKLSGYVSGPYDTFSMKALQYIYINSRFVCKGPIHKLLNQLATRFKCLDPLKINNGAQNGKRNGSQVHPSYILNLGCPWSFYDLTFEPSKTSVEFKDWVPILKFIERAITQFWNEKMADGKSFSHESGMPEKDEMWEEGDNNASAEEDFFVADLSKKSETATKVHWLQNQQVSVGNPSSPVEILTEESGHVPDREDDRISSHKSHKKTAEFKEQQTEMGFDHQNEYSFKSWDDSLSKCISTSNRESDNHLWTLDKDFFSSEDNFLENNFTATERSDDYMEDCFFGSSWGEESLKVDPSISRSTGSVRSYDCFEFSNHAEAVSKDLKKPFLQSCSSRGSTPSNGVLFARDEGFEFQIDDFRNKRKRLIPDDNIDGFEVDGSNQNVDFFPRTLWQGGAASGWFSTRLRKKCNMHTDLDFLSRDSAKLFSLDREHFTEEDDFPPDSAAEIGNFGSGPLSLNSEWHPITSDPPLFKKSMHWDIEHITRENALDWSLRSVRSASYEDFAKREGNDYIFSYDSMLNSLSQGNCSSSSCTNNELDFNGFASPKRDICKYLQGHNLDIFSPRRSDMLTGETDWSCLDSCGKYNTDNFAKSSYCIPSFTYIDKGENRRDLLGHQDYGQYYVHKERSMRSCSAPPFYRGKKKFVALNEHLTVKAGKPNAQAVHEASTLPETSELKHPQKSSGACHLYFKPTFVEDSLLEVRPDMKKMPDTTPDMNEIQKSEEFEKSQCHHIYDNGSIKDCIAEEPQDSIDTGIKWRNSHSHTANGDESPNFHDQCNILDISSGILHLAGNSLVPKSINKNCLEGAKVLQQVDKKFIPVVGGGTLAIIDQHAADERIRLEDLRQKVLLGEVKTITYLDAEQELVLPEIGYQLLHNYAEQIQNWGWICNIHAQGSRSFTKNLNLLHRQPAVVTLLAVPCILGVNLSDIDLLEFLQQLADTDGSSSMPPSVVRILNFKACRGAIMFGDTLLPSECSLIVEELKQTSLCFQCAHGRPTTVPLVNLEALHKQITKLGLLNDGSNESWHGLCRHELSLERTAQRLNLARGQC